VAVADPARRGLPDTRKQGLQYEAQRLLGRLGRGEEATAPASSWSGADVSLLSPLSLPVEADQPLPGNLHGVLSCELLASTRSAFAAGIICVLPYPSRCFMADLPRQEDPWPAHLSGEIASSSGISGQIA